MLWFQIVVFFSSTNSRFDEKCEMSVGFRHLTISSLFLNILGLGNPDAATYTQRNSYGNLFIIHHVNPRLPYWPKGQGQVCNMIWKLPLSQSIFQFTWANCQKCNLDGTVIKIIINCMMRVKHTCRTVWYLIEESKIHARYGRCGDGAWRD